MIYIDQTKSTIRQDKKTYKSILFKLNQIVRNSKHYRITQWIISILLAFFLVSSLNSYSQDTIQDKNKRLRPTLAVAGTAYAGGMTGLYFLWYKDYPQTSFHTLNDNSAWLQADKMGHSLSAYHLSKSSHSVFKWAGMREKKALWLGGIAGLGFLTSVEILDGFSSNWGFSLGDFTANVAGTTLFVGQGLLWGEQRVSLKFSYYPSEYAKYNEAVLGQNFQEQLIKDYNAQTFWLSFNLASFLKEDTKVPKWLNIAVGYGAKGLLNTYSNDLSNTQGIPNFNRTRQFYLSLDVDLSKIRTKSEFLNVLLDVASIIKFPFPALEYNKENGLLFHPIYF